MAVNRPPARVATLFGEGDWIGVVINSRGAWVPAGRAPTAADLAAPPLRGVRRARVVAPPARIEGARVRFAVAVDGVRGVQHVVVAADRKLWPADLITATRVQRAGGAATKRRKAAVRARTSVPAVAECPS